MTGIAVYEFGEFYTRKQILVRFSTCIIVVVVVVSMIGPSTLPIAIAQRANQPMTTIASPQLQTPFHQTIAQIKSGDQVMISTSVQNNIQAARPYTTIFEVRDSNDVTVYLQWQTGTLPSGGSTGVGLSWTPDQAGTYTVRTFVVTDIANPQVLSQVVSSKAVVA